LGNLELIKKKTSNSEIQDEPVFSIVEQMPEFPGGEDAMRQFIGQTIQYPKVAVQGNINGRVYVSFVIASNGKVRNAKIARGVHPSLDEEALRVINSLPAWKPGKQRGTPVNVSYTVPIKFMLQ
ncbi:MAG: energy transducer TonB, partial [Mariniphaga sp.]|nr:energy transducer TonB [Mariniphaga sp.]